MKSKIEPITREQFLDTPRDKKLDRFAGTFCAKADTMNLWPLAVGVVSNINKVVFAAICMRVSQRQPLIANLQLLHTFAHYRRQGLARRLVLHEYGKLMRQRVKYFRVSSEAESVEFYRSLGLKFWGEQKSGSLLCMHKVTSVHPEDGVYELDPVVQAAINSGRRGSLVKQFAKPQ